MKQSLPGLEQDIVKAWLYQNTLLELYSYKPEKPEKLPAHYHHEYQFCLSVDYPSESYYQKSVHFVPVGSLSIIHPGEMHSGTGKDVGNGRDRATFRMMYVQPKKIAQVAGGTFEQMIELPHFLNPILLDRKVTLSFLRFHMASQRQTSALEQDERLQAFLTVLLQRYAERRLTTKAVKRERPSVKRVCDYLQEHYTTNINLEQLAHIAELSPSYFSRVFKAETGTSLSHYQMQLRIDRARKLLLQGTSIKKVAADLGFVDQSHLTHTFKRFVHTTPGRYVSDAS